MLVLGSRLLQSEHARSLAADAGERSLSAGLVRTWQAASASEGMRPVQPSSLPLILLNLPVLTPACLWCLCAPIRVLTAPSCVKAIPNPCLTLRILPPPWRRPWYRLIEERTLHETWEPTSTVTRSTAPPARTPLIGPTMALRLRV